MSGTSVDALLKEMEQKLRRYFDKRKFEKKKDQKITISEPLFDERELVEVTRVLLSGWISQGQRVKIFENEFSKYISARHGVAVNSGSSANLISLLILASKMKPKDEIITPAVTWSTTVIPIFQAGLTPVFVDVDVDTFCIDPEEVEAAVSSRTRGIVLVHTLGHPADMKRLLEIAQEHELFVVEDCCLAHGAECYGKKVGSMGDLGTFSFFASHHMTTGEGGMIVTDNKQFDLLARTMRAHGRRPTLSDDEKSDAHNRFTFEEPGFSMKMTELEAAIGIVQLSKLAEFVSKRRQNAKHLIENLEKFSDFVKLPVERSWAVHVFYGFPITVKENAPFFKCELSEFLEKSNIETRPLLSGNVIKQPFMKKFKFKTRGSLANAEKASQQSFFIGCHPALTDNELNYVIEVFDKFFRNIKSRF